MDYKEVYIDIKTTSEIFTEVSEVANNMLREWILTQESASIESIGLAWAVFFDVAMQKRVGIKGGN